MPHAPDRTPDDPAWSRADRRAAAAFLLIAAAQVGLPLASLWQPRPARWGWQMYSAAVHFPRIAVVRRDGSEVEIRLDDHVVRARTDVALRSLLPPHLCRTLTAAAAVRFVAYPDTAAVTVPCAR